MTVGEDPSQAQDDKAVHFLSVASTSLRAITTYNPNSQPDGDSIARIFATIVGYAIKDAAREIHLQAPPQQRGFRIFYRLRESEELQEQMKVSIYSKSG